MECINRPGSLLRGLAVSLVATSSLLLGAHAHAQDMAPGLAPAAPPPEQAAEAPAPPPGPTPTGQVTLTTTARTTLEPVEAPKRQKKAPRPRFKPQFGLRGSVGAALARNTGVYGVDGKLRFRPWRIVGFDVGAGYYAGRQRRPEITFDKRSEIPITFEVDFFLKSTGFLQIYLMTGPFGTIAYNEDSDTNFGRRHDVYFGYSGGLGLELRLGKHLGVHAELRGFVRERVTEEDFGRHSDRPPEYIELDHHGRPTGRGTDVMGGGLLSLGASIYF